MPNRETERDGEKDKDRVKEERRKAKINQTRDGTKGNENRAPVRKREMKRLNAQSSTLYIYYIVLIYG